MHNRNKAHSTFMVLRIESLGFKGNFLTPETSLARPQSLLPQFPVRRVLLRVDPLMLLPELIEKFLHRCDRSGCKPATLRQYRGRLRPLAAAFANQAWEDLSREDLLNWIHDANRWPSGHARAGQEKSKSTQRANLIAVQMLQDYSREFQGGTRKLKKVDLKKPGVSRRERIPTPDEVLRILERAPAEWALVYRALRLTGARPSELTGAKIVDLHGNVLVLAEHKTSRKTGAPRKIPLGSQVAPLFSQAIDSRTEGAIFLDGGGKPWTVAKLSRIFRRLRGQLGLTPDLVLYSARHEFGTAVAKRYGILQAKELLGHTDIATTQRYTHLTEDELRQFQEGAITDVVPGDPADPPPAA